MVCHSLHKAIKAFHTSFWLSGAANNSHERWGKMEKKILHLLLANMIRAVWFIQRLLIAAKMLVSTVAVGQVQAVICSKLSLSVAYPSKTDVSYMQVMRLWTLYAAKHVSLTAWFTLPWFFYWYWVQWCSSWFAVMWNRGKSTVKDQNLPSNTQLFLSIA